MQRSESRGVLFLANKTLRFNTRIFSQARTLRRRRVEVTLVGVLPFDLPDREVVDEILIRRLSRFPLHARILRRANRARTRPGRFVLRYLWKLTRPWQILWLVLDFNLRILEALRESTRFDVIVVHNSDALAAGLLLARKWRARVVYDICELNTERQGIPPGVRRLVFWPMELLLARYADAVLAANTYYARLQSARCGHRVDRVLLSYPPATMESGPSLREHLDLDPATPLLVASGGIAPNRGLEETIRAMVHLPDAVLVIQGEGPHQGELERLVEELDLEGRVRFRPFVDQRELPRLLRRADVGLSLIQAADLQLRYSTPNRIFSYIHAGVPIVASYIPFHRGIVAGERLGLLCNPRSPGSIARAIRRILENPAEAERIRVRMRTLKASLCWERQEAAFLDLLFPAR